MTLYSSKSFLDALQREVMDDLRAHRYKVSGSLFPVSPSQDSGPSGSVIVSVGSRYQFWDRSRASYTISGITAEESKKHFAIIAGCESAAADKFADVDVLFTGLHKACHVATGVGRDAELLLRRFEKLTGIAESKAKSTSSPAAVPARTLIKSSLNESIADSAAALFMLKCFGSDPRILAGMKHLLAMRQINAAGDYHRTAAMLGDTISAWERNPTHDHKYKITDAVLARIMHQVWRRAA